MKRRFFLGAGLATAAAAAVAPAIIRTPGLLMPIRPAKRLDRFNLCTGAIYAHNITCGSITASQIVAGSILAEKLSVRSIPAWKLDRAFQLQLGLA